ncbi:MAG: DUF4185 domain-containing protein [Bacteroidia bacterium]|nr:DUF4185 domain-containing protein [Bacteroidia bacterium]
MKKNRFSKRNSIYIVVWLCSYIFLLVLGCSDNIPIDTDDTEPNVPEPEIPEIIGSIPNTVSSDIVITQHATKISQLTGDYDRHLNKPTLSQTNTRYRIEGTDLGVPFQDGETTWLLFGDTWGPKAGLHNVIGYTTDKTPEDGLKLDFLTDEVGIYQGIMIPGVNTTGAFEVPTGGIVIEDDFFIWLTTDHSEEVTMGRSVVAMAGRNNAMKAQFSKVYDLSTSKFINVLPVRIKNSDWNFLPPHEGDGLLLFASGAYRKSHVYLAYQPLSGIKNKNSIRYFAGIKDEKPLWNKNEKDAQPIFRLSDPGVGELSASYNKFIKKWILMYNHGDPRGINLRTSDTPWGPWSDPEVVFRPWEDGGYCHFIHTDWRFDNCDNVHNPGRENEWGGEYGPYEFSHFATGNDKSTTIYFTMSTWNPYEVVLMKASLRLK